MRQTTTLPHDTIDVRRLWNGSKGNCDNSRLPIDTIVIHTMVGTLNGSTAHFKNPLQNSAAHYGIDFQGRVVSWIPESVTAYHAGRYEVNQRSIGIEHEDNDNSQGIRPDALYESSAKLVADICNEYSIPLDRLHIKRHDEIKSTSCPGTLDIDRIISRAKEILTTGAPAPAIPVDPLVFTRLVTKATNNDNLLSALGINPELGAEAESWERVLAHVQTFITQEVNKQLSSREIEQPLTPAIPAGSPKEQSKSVLKKDIKEILAEIFAPFRRKKSSL